MTGTFSAVKAELVTTFLTGIGVNTHISYTDGLYGTLALDIAALKYLGITELRDDFHTSAPVPLSRYITIAQAGMHFTFMIEGANNAALLATLAEIDQINEAVPGSVIAIEGPNEINNYPVTFNGTTGLQGALDMQAAIYADVKADHHLAGVAVDYFTGYTTSAPGNGPDPVTHGLANFDNQHIYPLYGEPPASWAARSALYNTTVATEPAVYTEAGYSSLKTNPDVQAAYELDLLFDTAKEGITQTFLYELLDAYPPGSKQGDAGFGLFDDTTNAKPAATDIHNLTTILRAGEAGGSLAQPGTLAYTFTNLPADGNSMVLEEPDGNFFLAVWAEPEIWNNATSLEIPAPVETVTLSLMNSFNIADVFDPTTGTTAIATASHIQHLTFKLSDHPVLIELSGDPAPCFAAGTGILTPDGDVAVEHIRPGDLVITHTGEEASVIWIGRRELDLRRHPRPACVQPIAIAPGTFGSGQPSRALILSPDHALFLEGALIPAKALVNGHTIRQLGRDAVTYYHIELAHHAIIFAESMPVESYLDTGNRVGFDNADDVIALHPDLAQSHREQRSCAPFVEAGPVLARARQRAATQVQQAVAF